MRLKSVYIDDYKNLKKFTLPFDGDSFIDVFVGKNGTGKSNLFEALIEIFRHLYEYDKDKVWLDFEYRICFEIDGKETEIIWKSGEFTINGKNRKTIGETPLPDNVLIYYSGHNDTVAMLVKQYEEAFRKRIKKADFDESRCFIGIGPDYKELLLAVLLIQKANNKAREFIRLKLGIKTIAPEIKLVLQRPSYAVSTAYDIKLNDESDRYWKPEGITKDFLNLLSKCMSGPPKDGRVRTEGFLPYNDRYVLYLDINKVQQEFSNFSSQELFRQFDNLKTLDMLAEISIPLTLENDSEATIGHFSDGQFQSVYIYSIIELFKDRNCITLLDEPDAFLHPEWQLGFLEQVFDISDTESNNHVLLSSHSAFTLMALQQPHFNVFEVFNNTVKVKPFNKEEVLKILSGNRVFLTENESIMSISTYLKNSSQPVLFTEGISDEYILEEAWKQLFPGHSRPFCIHNAFDRIFLRNLFSRDEIRKNFPKRIMFALFDFDEAYDDWNGLKGSDEVTDPFIGLTRKLPHPSHYAMLLPVPTDSEIKNQVLNPDDKPWGKGSDSHLSIELLLFKEELVGTWFERIDISCGGKLIVFTGDKVKFAKEYVPSLDQANFEVFRPMFEFIKSKCPA